MPGFNAHDLQHDDQVTTKEPASVPQSLEPEPVEPVQAEPEPLEPDTPDSATYDHQRFVKLPGVDVRGSLPHRSFGQPH
jgi:hypothetical protein